MHTKAAHRQHRKAVSLAPIDRWYDTPVVQIGRTQFTRRQFAERECVNLKAVKNIGRICTELRIESVADLAKRTPWDLLDQKGVGLFTIYAIMELLGIAGKDFAAWIEQEPKRRQK